MLIFTIPGLFWFVFAMVCFLDGLIQTMQMGRGYTVQDFSIGLTITICSVLCAWMGYGVLRRRFTALLILCIPSVLLLVLTFGSHQHLGVMVFLVLVFLLWTIVAAGVELFKRLKR